MLLNGTELNCNPTNQHPGHTVFSNLTSWLPYFTRIFAYYECFYYILSLQNVDCCGGRPDLSVMTASYTSVLKLQKGMMLLLVKSVLGMVNVCIITELVRR